MEVVRQSILVSQNLLRKGLFDSFSKGRKAEPVGTVKEWGGKKYQKRFDEWVEIHSTSDKIKSLIETILRNDKRDRAWLKKHPEVVSSLMGMRVYHGTSSKNLVNIFHKGLFPKPNHREVKYLPLQYKEEVLKQIPKELYVTTNKQLAESFADTASEWGGKPVVLSFVLGEEDRVGKVDSNIDEEIVLDNTIHPDRLEIEGVDITKLKQIKRDFQDKSQKIKSLNTSLKEYGIQLKSGSKVTSRVLLYKNGNYEGSFLLEEISKYLPNEVSQEILSR